MTILGTSEFTVDSDMKEFYENEADNVIRNSGFSDAEENEAAETAAEETAAGETAEETKAADDGKEPEYAEAEAESAGQAEDAGYEWKAGEEAAAAKAAVAAEELLKEEETAEKAASKKDPKDREIADLKDRLTRNLAEFDNYRKRTDKEKAAMFDLGAKHILEKLLPVVDNFERAIQAAPADTENTALKNYAEGMEMIYRQLLKELEEAGVKAMDCKGQPFDPNFHNAVMHIEDESLGENVIAMELQKGYMYKEQVLRHAMVQVAN